MKHKCCLSIFVCVICMVILFIFGCQTIVDRITPAAVAPQAPSYIGETPKDIYSLYRLKLMKDAIAIQHRDKQLELLRAAEDDTYGFNDAKGFIEPAIQEANALQERIIGDDGNPYSVSGLLFLLTGGVVGRSFFRRPGDLTVDEARAKGATV